jgi:hypothetical protein
MYRVVASIPPPPPPPPPPSTITITVAGVAAGSVARTPTTTGGVPAAVTIPVPGVPAGSVAGVPRPTLLQTTSLGTGGKTLLQNSASSDFTFADAWTPTSGDVVLRMTFRESETNIEPLVVTVGGVDLTKQTGDTVGDPATAGVWIGTGRGISPGSPVDVRVNTNLSNRINKVEVRVDPLLNWGGSVGGKNSVLVDGSIAVTSVSVSATMARSTRLVLGAAVALDANCEPLTVSGWNVDDHQTSGSSALASTAAVFASGTGGNAGSTKTLKASSATACTEWAAAILEFS